MIWEERWHPLREEWIIIAAHRQNRPWHGETVAHEPAVLPGYVADCYLCPGNLRISGQRNEAYRSTFGLKKPTENLQLFFGEHNIFVTTVKDIFL